MRQNQNNKRSRGRGRRGNHLGQQNYNRNTTFDSNGPEGRLRGNAQQLFEKYTALAHDAQTSGERISAEAFSQFADHYYRVHQSILAAAEQRRQNDRQQDDKVRRIETEASDDAEAKAASSEAGAASDDGATAEASEETAKTIAEAVPEAS